MIIQEIKERCEQTNAAAQAETRRMAENYLIQNPGQWRDVRDSKLAAQPSCSRQWAYIWTKERERIANEKRTALNQLQIERYANNG